MHDPRMGQRMESAAQEARILSQNPQLRRKSHSVRNRLITLAVLVVLLVVVVVWLSAGTATPVE